MTRIVHLSDLHFGFHREDLVQPLVDLVNAQRADLIVLTGDLTHRGLPEQLVQAGEFLGGLRAPWMAVPGNHDVPLYNLPGRFLWPFRGWQELIAHDLAPVRQVGMVRVLGLNSVDPLSWQRGVIRQGEIARLTGGLDALSMNIVALHHPLQHVPGVDKQLARRAPEALARLTAAGAHIALSGHLHRWSAGAFLNPAEGRQMLQIQAGTALCARPSDVVNEFAVLEIPDQSRLRIRRHVAPMAGTGFNDPETLLFTRADGVWRAEGAAETG